MKVSINANSRNEGDVIYLVTAAMMSIPFFTSGKLWLQITLVLASLSQIISMEGFYRGWWMNNWFLVKEDDEA